MSAANASAKKRRTNPANITNNVFNPPAAQQQNRVGLSPSQPPPPPPAQPSSNQVMPLQQIIFMFDKRMTGLENKWKELDDRLHAITSLKKDDEDGAAHDDAHDTHDSHESHKNAMEIEIIKNDLNARMQSIADELTAIKSSIKPAHDDTTQGSENPKVDRSDFIELQEMVLKLHSHFVDLNRTWLQNMEIYKEINKKPTEKNDVGTDQTDIEVSHSIETPTTEPAVIVNENTAINDENQQPAEVNENTPSTEPAVVNENTAIDDENQQPAVVVNENTEINDEIQQPAVVNENTASIEPTVVSEDTSSTEATVVSGDAQNQQPTVVNDNTEINDENQQPTVVNENT